MEVCSNNNTTTTTLRIVLQTASNPDETEITLLSPSSPQPDDDATQQQQQPGPSSTDPPPTHALFAKHLQMKLKSHLEESSSSSSSSEEYFTSTSSSNDDTIATASSTSEIFYDFDDVVYDEELTSDYGTGGSNTIVDDDAGLSTRSNSSTSSSGSSSVVCEHEHNSHSNLEKVTEENEENEEEEKSSSRVRYQRSSSLKSGKTPPGTPMKKIVRFADAMGLDLIDIKMFVDEIPKVPKEAYRDLHIPDYAGPSLSSSPGSSLSNDPFSCFTSTFSFARNSSLNFVPLFHQPVSMPDFFDKIRDQKILLENAYLTQETITNNTQSNNQQQSTSSLAVCKHVIKGTVRVMNLDFHKSVYVRYTYNDWKDFTDFQATYMPGSCDGFSDRFEFRIEIDESRLPPPYITDDAKIAFACRFHCQGSQFWDNNQSRNYVFQNVPLQRSPVNTTTTTSSPPNNNNNNTMSTGKYSFVTSSRYSSFDDFDYEDKIMNLPPPPVPTAPPPTPPPEPVLPPAPQPPVESNVSLGGGGGSHMTASLYSPTSFYESAYGCYNQYGSACFY